MISLDRKQLVRVILGSTKSHSLLALSNISIFQCREPIESENVNSIDDTETKFRITNKDILVFSWQVAKGMEYLSNKKVIFEKVGCGIFRYGKVDMRPCLDLRPVNFHKFIHLFIKDPILRSCQISYFLIQVSSSTYT